MHLECTLCEIWALKAIFLDQMSYQDVSTPFGFNKQSFLLLSKMQSLLFSKCQYDLGLVLEILCGSINVFVYSWAILHFLNYLGLVSMFQHLIKSPYPFFQDFPVYSYLLQFPMSFQNYSVFLLLLLIWIKHID